MAGPRDGRTPADLDPAAFRELGHRLVDDVRCLYIRPGLAYLCKVPDALAKYSFGCLLFLQQRRVFSTGHGVEHPIVNPGIHEVTLGNQRRVVLEGICLVDRKRKHRQQVG